MFLLSLIIRRFVTSKVPEFCPNSLPLYVAICKENMGADLVAWMGREGRGL